MEQQSVNEDSSAVVSGLFRATSIWNGILQCIFCLPKKHESRRVDSDNYNCFSEYFTGKDIHSGLLIYLRTNAHNFPECSEMAALRLCQQLLDCGAIYSINHTSMYSLRRAVSKNKIKFENKSNYHYRLNKDNPCIAPFISTDSPRSQSTSNLPDLVSVKPFNQKKVSFDLESSQSNDFTKLIRQSMRGRTRSQLPTDMFDCNEPNDLHCSEREHEQSEFNSAATSKNTILGSLNAIRQSIRRDYNQQSHKTETATVDFYIHHLCLQRLLKLIDLPMIDQLVYTETLLASASSSKMISSHGKQDFDDSVLVNSPGHENNITLTPNNESTAAVNKLTHKLSQIYSNCGWSNVKDLSGVPNCFETIQKFFSSAKDPLGWQKLNPIFVSLTHNLTSSKRAMLHVSQVLQLSFALLSFRQRQLSLLLLVSLDTCRNNETLFHVDWDKLLSKFANSLLTDLRGQRSQRLFAHLVENANKIFTVPEDIFEKAHLLKRAKFDPDLLAQSVYCQQVSREEYRRVTREATDSAIKDLMEHILDDPKLTLKEKKTKMLIMKRSHPDIFNKHFTHFLQ